MNQVQKLKELQNLSYFDKSVLQQFMSLTANSLYANIKRWLRQGVLIKLKNGLYVTASYYASREKKEEYAEFMANKLREPSYLSLEYVLQNYGILSEAVYAFTSITLKTKRDYANRLGRFSYRNIKESLFTGFEIQDKGECQVKIATKAKALFDYLYFKFKSVASITKEELISLRLNLDGSFPKDLAEFDHYVKKSAVKKYLGLPKLIRIIRDY